MGVGEEAAPAALALAAALLARSLHLSRSASSAAAARLLAEGPALAEASKKSSNAAVEMGERASESLAVRG